MRIAVWAGLGLALATPCAGPLWAQGNNPEDAPLTDEDVPTVPRQPTTPATAPTQAPPVGAPENHTPPPPSSPLPDAGPPAAGAAPPAPAGEEMVTIPRAVWQKLVNDVEQLKSAQGSAPAPAVPTTPATSTPGEETPPPLEGMEAPATPVVGAPATGAPAAGAPATGAPAAGAPATAPGTEPASSGGGKSLLLPDISFEAQAKGRLGTDRRDTNRNVARLSEGEIGIQSYVYPNVKADAFITAAPDENSPFQVEEAYLTFLGFRPGLNIKVGRQHTPFGRTGLPHTHSWLYARQVAPIRNLVDPEALSGDGVNFSYVLPTRGTLFAQADLGLWHGTGNDPGTLGLAPIGTQILEGPGASYNGSFQTGRLWLGHPAGPNAELELGGSYARGASALQSDTGNLSGAGHLTLSGADVTYRRFGTGARRLLLRSEYFGYSPDGGLPTRHTNGYYLFGNYRFDPYKDIGLLFERSGFPQDPRSHEAALSLILTKQLTEQFYMRLQGSHGSRPGKRGFNEMLVQFTWGVGPHTHNLE